MDMFSSKKTKCAGCGNKIDSKEPKVEALKKHYHAACFACHKCNKAISGDFRPVDDKPWCDKCYAEHKAPKCDECGKGILDKRIKTEDGRSFHERCFANASQGDCSSCGKKIGLNEPVTDAMGQLFHEGCFRCEQCGGDLPAEFHVKDDKPVCEACHKKNRHQKEKSEAVEVTETSVRSGDDEEPRSVQSEANLSDKTPTVVRDANLDSAVQLDGDHSLDSERSKTATVIRDAEGHDAVLLGHPPHRLSNVLQDAKGTSCAVCLEDTSKESHKMLRGRHFHSNCFDNAHSGQCSGCNEKIRLTEASVSVAQLGKDWHPACLNCGQCNNQIPGAFRVHNDVPVCDDCHRDHNSPKCANCDQPVDGDTLKAMSQYWHPDCFTCSVCHEALYKNGTEYFNVEGKPFCKQDLEAAHISVA